MANRWWEVGPPFDPAPVPGTSQIPGGASIDNGLSSASMFVRNDVLWLVGGYRWFGQSHLSVFTYDLEANSWTHEFDLDRLELGEDVVYNGLTAGFDSVNDIAYVLDDNNNLFFSIDIAAKTTTLLASPTGTINGEYGVTYYDGFVYTKLASTDPQRFDVGLGTWAGVTAWAHGGSDDYAPTVLYSDEIYVLIPEGDFAKYDPDLDSWTTLTSLGTATASGHLIVVGTDIYRVGGWLHPSFAWPTVMDKYNGATWSTETVPPNDVGGTFGVNLHGYIVYGGGYDDVNSSGRVMIWGDGQHLGAAELEVTYGVESDSLDITYDSFQPHLLGDLGTIFPTGPLPDQLRRPILYYDEAAGEVHALGGQDPNLGNADTLKHYSFDEGTRVWTTETDLPATTAGRSELANQSLFIGGKAYFVDATADSLFEYDPGGNTLTDLLPNIPMDYSASMFLDTRDNVSFFLISDSQWFHYDTVTGLSTGYPAVLFSPENQPEIAFIRNNRFYWVDNSNKLLSMDLQNDSYHLTVGPTFDGRYQSWFVQGEYLYGIKKYDAPTNDNGMLRMSLDNLPEVTYDEFQWTDALPQNAWKAQGSDVVWFAAGDASGNYDQFFGITFGGFMGLAVVEVTYKVESPNLVVTYDVQLNYTKALTVTYEVPAGFNTTALLEVTYSLGNQDAKILTVLYDMVEDAYDGQGFVSVGVEVT